MHNFLTSVHPEGDIRSALLSVIQALHLAKNGTDIVSRTPVSTSSPKFWSIYVAKIYKLQANFKLISSLA